SDAAMCAKLLCGMFICVLKAGIKGAEVTQFPRYRVARTGEKLTLQCSQNMNYLTMYWYQQNPGFGLQLIYYSPGTGSIEKGKVPEGHLVSRSETQYFPLTLVSTSANQTSVYFCTSS
ncbi:T-cell receptor beta chain V region PHDS203, partial [Heterocephalus glaber]